jgi:hypothetical protein
MGVPKCSLSDDQYYPGKKNVMIRAVVFAHGVTTSSRDRHYDSSLLQDNGQHVR